jgi:hypothetical protein
VTTGRKPGAEEAETPKSAISMVMSTFGATAKPKERN